MKPMLRVLLIDGDDASAAALTAADNAGLFAVERARTLGEGLARMADAPDAVIAALDLPDSSGFQTVLRVQARSPAVALIAMGDRAQEDLGRHTVERGAQDFIVRGALGPESLRRVVTSCVSRQRALNALKGREDLVRSLTMMNVDGILIVDADGVVRFANPAAEAIFAPQRLLGEPFGHPLDSQHPAEIALADPDGARRTYEVRSAPIRWKGAPARLASLREVTARKRAEEALRKAHDAAQDASQAKSDFVAHMSHEIRTPINSILGMTEVLAATPLTDDQREPLRVLQRSGELLLHLVNNILDLSKIEAGALELEQADFDVLEQAENVASTLDLAARRKGLELRRRFDGALARRRRGDAGRLCQVLVNLLSNALKFTERGGVCLAVEDDPEAPGHRVLFSVSDTGIGIPTEKAELIFESFRQADSSVTRRYGGTGLGLSISRRLVSAMGGRLRLDSVPGRGSRFHFSLELEPAAAAPEAAAGPAGPLGPARPLRILLADDSPDNRLLVLRFLRGSPHSVVEAADGREAVARFAAGGFDLVLMDVQMPELDGLSAAREIRRLEGERGSRATPIVALTASVAREEIERCLEAGCTAHISKPVSRAALLGAIAAYALAATRDGCDPDVSDLLPVYLESRRRDLEALEAALARGDFAALAQTSHRIRGSAAGYGLPELGDACVRLEGAADARDAGEAAAALALFSDALRRGPAGAPP